MPATLRVGLTLVVRCARSNIRGAAIRTGIRRPTSARRSGCAEGKLLGYCHFPRDVVSSARTSSITGHEGFAASHLVSPNEVPHLPALFLNGKLLQLLRAEVPLDITAP